MKIEKSLGPGDTLQINTETLEVKLNGSPAPEYVAGRVLDLSGGTNTVRYTDDETGRTIELKVKFKPRYI